MAHTKITLYGTHWCSDCKRAKKFFGEQRVHYDFIDVDMDSGGLAFVERANNGKQIIPTIVFEDGGGMVEHIDPGETGFVVADQPELETTVRRLLADTALAERVGSRGRAAIRARYTARHSAHTYKELYTSALRGGDDRDHA